MLSGGGKGAHGPLDSGIAVSVQDSRSNSNRAEVALEGPIILLRLFSLDNTLGSDNGVTMLVHRGKQSKGHPKRVRLVGVVMDEQVMKSATQL